MEKAEQQALDLQGPITPDFDNYIVGGNDVLVAMLMQLAVKPDGWHYLSGALCSGKTHLLQAVMHRAMSHEQDVYYLPLRSASVNADLINHITPPDLLLLDDVDAISTRPDILEALFHCLNRIHQQHKSILVSAAKPVGELNLLLPDLQSRLAKCQRHVLSALSDGDLTLFARNYLNRWSIPIGDEVLAYMQKRGPRNRCRFLSLLDGLINTALNEKKLITKAIVREAVRV